MEQNVSISMPQHPHRIFTNVFLVRGVAKRAIKVIVRPFHGLSDYTNDQELALGAAKYAAKKGWKIVVVAPDDYYGEDALMYNWHQFTVDNLDRGWQGKFLAHLGNRNGHKSWYD